MKLIDKAQAYDEVLNKLRHFIAQGVDPLITRADVKDFFPGLVVESEDERIRKSIIKFLIDVNNGAYTKSELEIASWIAWLERKNEKYALKSFKDEDVRKFMQYIEKEAKAYEFNLPNRGYDIYAFAKDILSWLEKQSNKNTQVTLPTFTFEDVLALECSMKTAKITKCGDKLYEMLVSLYDKIHNAYLLEKQGEQKHVPKHKIGDTIYYSSFGEVESMVVSNVVMDGTDNPMYEDKEGNAVFEKDLIEQNPVDKVEPKFKNGQWIVWKDKCYKVNYNGCGYELVDQDGLSTSLEYDTIDENAHIWDVTTDANDGDVLCYKNENENELRIFIYKNGHIHYHCCYYNGHLTTVDSFFVVEKYLLCYIHPATKEQCELLFQKMKEEGYKWNNKNKELKKFHVIDEGKDEMDYCFTKMMNGEKISSVWSEEDEKRLDTICGLLEDIPSHQNWLRTLKDRVQLQQRMTCNEEDKEKLERIINKASYNCGLKNDDISFLKSLKERYFWKPSDEQITWLYRATDEAKKDSRMKQVLNELLYDLKKLKGE